jgi:hypothetical protein
MAIYNLNPPVGATTGGTWAIVSEDCNNTITLSGAFNSVLTIGEPVIDPTCTVVLSYTVGTVPCQVVSTHQFNITPKTCVIITGGLTDYEDWQLNLAPLTINGVLQTNFAYAIVPENDDCTTYANAIAWGYKGTCVSAIPNDTTPKTNFDPLPNVPITTFQVPAGNYKLVVVCSEHTLGACEKIDCCGVNVVVNDLDLCTEADNCAGETLSYTTNDNFTIYIPMTVTENKCVRMDFNGGGTILDKIELEVNTNTHSNPIWTTVDLNLLNVSTSISTQNSMSIVVRCALTSALPNIPILPAGSQLVLTNKYHLRWKVSRDTVGSTNWSVNMSCCDCLQICPTVIPTCITNVDVDLLPVCANCGTIYIKGNYGYSKDEYLEFIDGSCNPTTTCLGTAPNGTAYSSGIINNLGTSSPSSNSFKIYLNNSYVSVDDVVPPVCGVKYRLLHNVTISVTPTSCTIDFMSILNDTIYLDTKAMLSALLLTDYSNTQIIFGTIYTQGTDLSCGDLNTLVGTPSSFFMVNNGSPVVIAFNDILRTVTFTNIHPTTGTCVNMLLLASPKTEIFQCHYPLTGATIVGDIIGNNTTYLIKVTEIVPETKVLTYAGNTLLTNVCPALGQINHCYFLDATLPGDTWMLTSTTQFSNTCSPVIGIAYLIYQGSTALNFSTTYGSGRYVPLIGNTCKGWHDTITNAYYIKDTSYVSGYCV